MERYKFRTHLNYIKCLSRLLSRTTIRVPENLQPKNKRDEERFLRLALPTMKSIEFEYQTSKNDSEFAQAIALWIPVKCYYLIYYLEAILVSKITGSNKVFHNQGHSVCSKLIKQCLKDRTIVFSNESLNKRVRCIDIEPFSTLERETIQPDYYLKDKCIDSVLKKLFLYKEEVFKRDNKITYKSKLGRELKVKSLDPKELALVDFFYWMRIKTNYKIADFLDAEKDIAPAEAAIYVNEYVGATKSYSIALMKAINLPSGSSIWF